MARNPVAEPSAVVRAEPGARARRWSRLRRRLVERPAARRLCVLAPMLLAAMGVAAGSASALVPHKRHQRRLALRPAADRGAPSLSLSGATLHWTATAASHQYAESRTTGASITYDIARATADTTPPARGATLT